MEDPALREDFARDVVLLKYVGMNPVVVHGGGPDITAYMERLDIPVEFVGGLRVSSAETVEIAKMVLVGKVNKDIVSRLNRHGQPSIGLSRRRRPAVPVRARRGAGRGGRRLRRADHAVNVDVLKHIADDYIPVIASVGTDRDGHSYNINADEAAGAVARALRAYKVLFLTDVSGWLRDPANPLSRISAGHGAEEVEDALTPIAGGMRPKLQACVEAIHGGVTAAHIVDGRVPHSILLELFTDEGIGTKIKAARDERRRARPGLRAPARRVRPRLGRAAVGRRGHRVPRPPDRAWRSTPSATATRRSSRRSREQAAPLIHVGNLFHTAPGATLARAAGGVLARRPRALRQLRHRGQRGRDQDGAQGQARRRRSSRCTAASTAAPTAR